MQDYALQAPSSEPGALDDVYEQILALRGRLEPLPNFAGLWVDAQTQRVKVGVVGAATRVRELVDEFERPDLVDVLPRPTGYQALEAAHARIAAAMARVSQEEHSHIGRVGVNVVDNRVEVAVSRLVSGVEKRLRELAGDVPVHVYLAPPPETVQLVAVCSSRSECVPKLRGGLRLQTEPSLLTIKRCTSGFEAQRPSDLAWVVLTAGHCFDFSEEVKHANLRVGFPQVRQFGGDTDAESIPQVSTTWTGSNYVYYDDTQKQYQITSVASSDLVGTAICRSGISTGVRCGAIREVNQTIQFLNGPTLSGQTFTDACALPGDSGGPYAYAGRGHGMASGANFPRDTQNQPTCSGWSYPTHFSTYTPLARVQTRLNVIVRTSPA